MDWSKRLGSLATTASRPKQEKISNWHKPCGRDDARYLLLIEISPTSEMLYTFATTWMFQVSAMTSNWGFNAPCSSRRLSQSASQPTGCLSLTLWKVCHLIVEYLQFWIILTEAVDLSGPDPFFVRIYDISWRVCQTYCYMSRQACKVTYGLLLDYKYRLFNSCAFFGCTSVTCWISWSRRRSYWWSSFYEASTLCTNWPFSDLSDALCLSRPSYFLVLSPRGSNISQKLHRQILCCTQICDTRISPRNSQGETPYAEDDCFRAWLVITEL